MTLKPFFVDALSSALDLGVGKPEDILKHVTPDVLAQHLPRPLWARLLTACLGASKVDATLIVETIGIPNLCEHVPATIIWPCIADIAHRALGLPVEVPVPVVAAPAAAKAPRAPLTAPPPEATPQPLRVSSSAPVPAGPAIPSPSPLSDLVAELEAEEPVSRPRTSTSQRFRASNTGIGRPLGSGGVRRPQAAATGTPARATPRRGATEVTDGEVAVDDSQLVDWRTDGGTDDDDDDFKR